MGEPTVILRHQSINARNLGTGLLLGLAIACSSAPRRSANEPWIGALKAREGPDGFKFEALERIGAPLAPDEEDFLSRLALAETESYSHVAAARLELIGTRRTVDTALEVSRNEFSTCALRLLIALGSALEQRRAATTLLESHLGRPGDFGPYEFDHAVLAVAGCSGRIGADAIWRAALACEDAGRRELLLRILCSFGAVPELCAKAVAKFPDTNVVGLLMSYADPKKHRDTLLKLFTDKRQECYLRHDAAIGLSRVHDRSAREYLLMQEDWVTLAATASDAIWNRLTSIRLHIGSAYTMGTHDICYRIEDLTGIGCRAEEGLDRDWKPFGGVLYLWCAPIRMSMVNVLHCLLGGYESGRPAKPVGVIVRQGRLEIVGVESARKFWEAELAR